MTMTDLLDTVAAALRTSQTAPVEKYWRTQPPTELTFYIQPRSEDSEQGATIGNVWRKSWTCDVVIEAPWDDTETTGDAVTDAVEAVRAAVHADRDLGGHAEVVRVGNVSYQFVARGGQAAPAYAATVAVTCRSTQSEV